METIIFGGTFDPPTKAHEEIIHSCLSEPEVSEVWVMPSGARTDKPGMASEEERLCMLGLMKQNAFSKDQRLIISDYEINLPQPTQTIHTVKALSKAYPERQFRFVFGADSYNDMENWEDGLTLKALIKVLIVPRGNFALPEENEKVKHLNLQLSVSSTQVRHRVEENDNMKELVCPAVARYILGNGLYKAD